MLASAGNLSRVRQTINERELAIGDIVDHPLGLGINAEMDAEVSPAWYLVETVPGQERIAAAHLAGRRFGIFIPDIRFMPQRVFDKETGQRRIVAGERLPRLRRMFVGYIFVFAWLNGRNLARIKAVPGVHRIVCWPEGRVAKLKDEQVGELRALEAILCPVEIPEDWRKPSRKRHGWRKERARAKAEQEEKAISAVKGWINIGDQWISTIEALRVLDGRDENQSVAKALGLAS